MTQEAPDYETQISPSVEPPPENVSGKLFGLCDEIHEKVNTDIKPQETLLPNPDTEAQSEQVELPKHDTAFVGDSLTVGYAHGNLDVVNVAAGGKRIEDMDVDFDAVLNAVPKPKRIVLLGGTNNLRVGDSADFVISHIESMANKAKQVGVELIIGTIPPMGKWLTNPDNMDKPADKTPEEIIKEIGRVNDWIINRFPGKHIDFNQALADPQNPNDLCDSNDGLHPNEYGTMAALVRQKLAEQ